MEIRDLRKKEKFIIDDAYLNGFAKKCGIYATGVYVSLCRHANKEQKSWPGIDKIAEELSISSKSVKRGIAKLIEFNIIKKERPGKKMTNRYYLLDKSEWKSDGTDRPIREDSQTHHRGLTDPSIVRKHRKGNTPKGKAKNKFLLNINPIIDLFGQVNPSYKRLFSNKTQRQALSRLVEEHGEQRIIDIINFLPRNNQATFAPVITTPLQLEKKLGQMIAYWQKNKPVNNTPI